MKEWKDIEGYEGFYQVSSDGDVRSIERTIIYKDGRCYNYKSKVLNRFIDSDGYESVVLSINKNAKTVKVHREVLKAFTDKSTWKRECNHKNGNKADNRLPNLEWATSSENKIHAVKTGLSNPVKNLYGARKISGSNHFYAKSARRYNGYGFKIYNPINDAKKDGFNLPSVYKALNTGKEYRGFYWKRDI